MQDLKEMNIKLAAFKESMRIKNRDLNAKMAALLKTG